MCGEAYSRFGASASRFLAYLKPEAIRLGWISCSCSRHHQASTTITRTGIVTFLDTHRVETDDTGALGNISGNCLVLPHALGPNSKAQPEWHPTTPHSMKSYGDPQKLLSKCKVFTPIRYCSTLPDHHSSTRLQIMPFSSTKQCTTRA